MQGVHAGNLVKLAAPLVGGKGGGQAAVRRKAAAAIQLGAQSRSARDSGCRLDVSLCRRLAMLTAASLLGASGGSGGQLDSAYVLQRYALALQTRRIAEGRRLLVHRFAGRAEQHRAASPHLSQRDERARRNAGDRRHRAAPQDRALLAARGPLRHRPFRAECRLPTSCSSSERRKTDITSTTSMKRRRCIMAAACGSTG